MRFAFFVEAIDAIADQEWRAAEVTAQTFLPNNVAGRSFHSGQHASIIERANKIGPHEHGRGFAADCLSRFPSNVGFGDVAAATRLDCNQLTFAETGIQKDMGAIEKRSRG